MQRKSLPLVDGGVLEYLKKYNWFFPWKYMDLIHISLHKMHIWH